MSMMFSIYVTLGIFLLHCNPRPIGKSQPDRLHSMVKLRPCCRYGTQALRNIVSRDELVGVAVLIVIGATLTASRLHESILYPPGCPIQQAIR